MTGNVIDTRLAYVYVVEGSRNGYPMINDCSLRQFKLTNLNEGYMADIINKYQPNDEILIDNVNKKITVNERGANSDFITGSEFISIPPGENQKLDILYSDFTETSPNVEISWKERIL
jgi:hypothetical protein